MKMESKWEVESLSNFVEVEFPFVGKKIGQTALINLKGITVIITN